MVTVVEYLQLAVKYSYVAIQLQTYHDFTTLILSQLSDYNDNGNNDTTTTTSVTPTSPTLVLLNQGRETTLGFKRLIAEFVGIPLGTDLQLYEKAYLILHESFRVWHHRNNNNSNNNGKIISFRFAF